MKRIVTIQDISCIGKCSLTVALPIISAMGVETAIVPTAVLSTHTAFNNFTFCDLTKEIQPISDHWNAENFKFDAVYTGYLGSKEQIDLMASFFDRYKADGNIIFVDPAMGDNGKLYKGFDQDFAKDMAKLCSKADIIVPNLTEACFMLGAEYKESGYDEAYIKGILKDLCKLGCKTAVLTGVSFEEGKLGVMSYNAKDDRFFSYYNNKIPKSFHGTGDIFASTCVGALMNGLNLDKALEISADYTAESIQATLDDPKGNWYGVNFEEKFPYLLKRLGK